MTNKERAAQSYARKKEKQDDKKRRGLVAELMQIYRYMAPVLKMKRLSQKSYEEACENKRKYFRKLHDELLNCPYDALLMVKSTLEDTSDQRGRLHNERSGEGKRKNGMSEIERIIAIRAQREQETRVAPTGTKPDSIDAKPVVDKLTPEHLKFLEQEHDTFTRMIEKHTYESGSDVVCRLCATDLSPEGHIGPPTSVEYLRLSPSDVRFHFEQEYGRGERLVANIHKLTEAGAESLAVDAQRLLNNCLHHRLFLVAKKALMKERKQASREFRRISPEHQKGRQTP